MNHTISVLLKMGESAFAKPIDLPSKYGIGERLMLTCENSENSLFTEVDLKIIDITYNERLKRTTYITRCSEIEKKETVKTACLNSKDWTTVLYPPPKSKKIK